MILPFEAGTNIWCSKHRRMSLKWGRHNGFSVFVGTGAQLHLTYMYFWVYPLIWCDKIWLMREGNGVQGCQYAIQVSVWQELTTKFYSLIVLSRDAGVISSESCEMAAVWYWYGYWMSEWAKFCRASCFLMSKVCMVTFRIDIRKLMIQLQSSLRQWYVATYFSGKQYVRAYSVPARATICCLGSKEGILKYVDQGQLTSINYRGLNLGNV